LNGAFQSAVEAENPGTASENVLVRMCKGEGRSVVEHVEAVLIPRVISL
jgi:hypothetical protein